MGKGLIVEECIIDFQEPMLFSCNLVWENDKLTTKFVALLSALHLGSICERAHNLNILLPVYFCFTTEFNDYNPRKMILLYLDISI